jgi:hypothetical protein
MAQYVLTLGLQDTSLSPTSISGVVATAGADPAGLVTALAGVCVTGYGVISANVTTAVPVTTTIPDTAGSGECERGKKWAVACKDAVTGRISTKYIPMADFSKAEPGTDYLSVTGAGASLVSAMEALFKSPAGNAIKVVSIKKARS